MVRNRKGKTYIDPHVKYAEEVDKAVHTFNEERRDGTSVEAARHFGERMADLRDICLHILHEWDDVQVSFSVLHLRLLKCSGSMTRTLASSVEPS